MKNILSYLLLLLIFTSCQKSIDDHLEDRIKDSTPVNQYTEYFIAKGAQYASQSQYLPVSVTDMKFTVKFDNSASYRTVQDSNQADINKLYGFSDNELDHHQFSARFGWRWYENNLQLLAYVYNNGVREYKLLCNVAIGAEILCGIKVSGNQYIFTLNGVQTIMPRAATTTTGKGYQLYPFFGGTEASPQDIRIWIKNS